MVTVNLHSVPDHWRTQVSAPKGAPASFSPDKGNHDQVLHEMPSSGVSAGDEASDDLAEVIYGSNGRFDEPPSTDEPASEGVALYFNGSRFWEEVPVDKTAEQRFWVADGYLTTAEMVVIHNERTKNMPVSAIEQAFRDNLMSEGLRDAAERLVDWTSSLNAEIQAFQRAQQAGDLQAEERHQPFLVNLKRVVSDLHRFLASEADIKGTMLSVAPDGTYQAEQFSVSYKGKQIYVRNG